ncbi:RelA/SpoT family protein [Patescibacteria group bacterium]|nr:RelA/SpoT family protein [Patescibacteria group bacterium]
MAMSSKNRLTKTSSLKNRAGVIGRAYKFAEDAHRGQLRKSGEPYFSHALITGETLQEWGLDESTIAAGLLHDVVEDTDVTDDELQKEFGEEIAFLVRGVTKIGGVKYRGHEKQVENLRKMMLAMAEDLRVVLIKLADRLHNMQTLSALPDNKRKRIALETTEIYAPLAYRLGMQKLSGELEDLAFPYVYPSEYRWLIKNLKEKYENREIYLKKIQPIVEKALRDVGVNTISVSFRAKRYSSLYKKLLRYEMNIELIYDLVAFRIVVKNVEDCYAALGAIHNTWTPLPGRIKDYIAMPKPNGYRSLHTTVIGAENKIIEFQIRTEEMHQQAENGIAAHWAYEATKGGKKYVQRKSVKAGAEEMEWVEQLRSWQQEFTDSQEFIDSLKIDFLKDRMFVITPKGDVIDLPQGATPVDFAYRIHSEIGNQCVGAKVNENMTPLDHVLHSGDVVEIFIQRGKKPSLSWLEFVTTPTASGHIRDALKGTRHSLKIDKAKHAELKIKAEERIGLLRDVTDIISRSHVSILKAISDPHRGFHSIKIICNTDDKTKVLKIILKIKSLKGVKSVDYRFV